jgi:Zn-dependent metalloprotease
MTTRIQTFVPRSPAAPNVPASSPSRATAPVQPRVDTASRFDPAKASVSTAERAQGHVTLPSLAPGQPSAPNRPIALESPRAQTAIQTSLKALGVDESGLDPTGVRFVPREVTVDELGMTHVRFDRSVNGQAVLGSQTVTHLGKDGQLASISGDTEPVHAPTPVRALVSPERAEAIARSRFEGVPESARSEPVLVRGPDGAYVSAVHVQLKNLSEGEPRDMHYLVDATTGELMDEWNQIDPFLNPADASSSACPTPTPEPTPTPGPESKVDDTSLYSGKVDIGATQKADGTWKLEDQTRGKGVETRDANNAWDHTGAVEIDDDDNVWGEATDPERSKAAVDAQYGAEKTYDFYKDVLGRDSIDGKGEALINNVHIRKDYVNAFWDGTQMNYGDGDGAHAGPLTAIDVAGHEITHGLTERTAGLQYRGESGGLNEAMSDILGKGVEWYAAQENPAVSFSWGVGASMWTPGKDGDALRYMDDPTKDGKSLDNYQNYKPGIDVHYSSGIANNAFTLLVQGGTNRTSGIEVKDGIGMEKAEKIFARALTLYMTPTTTFAQAREYTLQAAADLYGADSVEVKTLAQAWTAVGVN